MLHLADLSRIRIELRFVELFFFGDYEDICLGKEWQHIMHSCWE
jgi:hypothetical protein